MEREVFRWLTAAGALAAAATALVDATPRDWWPWTTEAAETMEIETRRPLNIMLIDNHATIDVGARACTILKVGE